MTENIELVCNYEVLFSIAIYNITFTPYILIGILEPGLHKLLKSTLLGNAGAYAPAILNCLV